MSTTRVSTHAIRGIGKNDLSQLRSHMTRLGSDGRRSRFGYHVSDRFLDAYAERCVAADATLYGYFENGMMRGVGEMHLDPAGTQQGDPEGELAFSIESRWRGCGIGTRLIRRLLIAARHRRVERLMMRFSSDNFAMFSLARRFATHLMFEDGIVTGHVPIRGPRQGSCSDEVVDDAVLHALAVPNPYFTVSTGAAKR